MVGSIDRQLRAGRRLVGRGDAGELLDLAGASLLVQALGVAPLAGLEVGLDVDFVEPTLILIRPSWGTLRSAMSSLAMILIRDMMEA